MKKGARVSLIVFLALGAYTPLEGQPEGYTQLAPSLIPSSPYVARALSPPVRTLPLLADTLTQPRGLIALPRGSHTSTVVIAPDWSTITLTEYSAGSIQKIPFTAPLKWYFQSQVEATRRGIWSTAFKTGRPPDKAETPGAPGGAFREVVGLDVGEFGRVSLSAHGNINVNGKMVFQDQELVYSKINETQNTHLEFDQKQRMDIQGKVGDRITVGMDYDSERDFDWENNIRISYSGVEDDILQKVEAGNVSLSLPGSQSLLGSANHKGLFGIKTISKLGPLDVTAIASVVNTKQEQQEYKGSTESKTQKTKDTDYVKNQYFFIHEWFRNGIATILDGHLVTIPPFYPLTEGLHPIGNLIVRDFELYRLDNSTNAEADPGVAQVDIDNPDESLDQTGNFKRLERGQDYSLSEDLGYIRLRQRAQDEVLGCTFILVDRFSGDTVLTVGEGSGNLGTYLVLKMIKPRLPTPDDPLWDLIFKNVYFLGTTNINRDGFALRIRNMRLPVPSDLDPLGTYYITHFGLDSLDENGVRQADELVDLSNPNIVNLVNGELIFPTYHPFVGEALPGGNTNPALKGSLGEGKMYTTTNRTEISNDSRFQIEADYTNQSSTINLGFMIVEGSEQVLQGGVPLTRGVDYQIDYFTGTLILSEDIESEANVRILFDKHELVSFDKKTILGLRTQMDLGPRSYLGSTAMFYNQSVINEKIEVGYEPMRNFIWGANGRYERSLEGLSQAVDRLPLVDTEQPSSFSLEGEISQVWPNPNPVNNRATGDPRGVAYIDDFEGAKRTASFPIQRRFWKESSAPLDPTRDRPYPQRYRARLNWYNPYGQVRTRDIWPNLSTSIRAQNETTDILVLQATPRSHQDAVPRDSIWNGLITPLYSGDYDQTQNKFFEIWVQGQEGNLTIDLGQISEDWDGNGRLNTEDLPAGGLIGDGILDDAEDVGLDGCGDDYEDGWGGCLDRAGPTYQDYLAVGADTTINRGADVDPADPNSDNWHYSEGSNDYSRINGTEDNALDAGRYPDTEDLDRTGFLDRTNNYFTATIALDDTTYLAGETKRNGVPTGWRLFRIPLMEFTKIGPPGSQEWNNIRHLRIILSGLETTISVYIAKIELVGNEWQELGIAEIGASKFSTVSGDSVFAVTVINTEDNANYQPPKRVQGEYDRINDIRSKEQSLVLKFNALPPGNQGAAMKTLLALSGQRAQSYLTYKRLKMYLYGDSPWIGSQKTALEFFLRFGFGENYYEISQPVYQGWDEGNNRNAIDLDLNRLTRLKLQDSTSIDKFRLREKDVFIDSADVKEYHFSDDSGELTGKRIRVTGQPSLDRIQYFVAGVRNRSLEPVTGEVWIDELRLSGVNKEKGTSLRLQSSFRLADLASTSLAYSRQEADFHTLQKRLGTNKTGQKLNLNTRVNLHRVFPSSWGLNIPLSSSLSTSLQQPKYLPGQDVRVDPRQLPDSILIKAAATNLNLKISKTGKSDRRLIKYTLDRVSGSFSTSRRVASNEIQKRVLNEGYSGKLGYSLPFGRDNYVTPFRWLQGIPWVGDRIGNLNLYYTPANFNTSLSFAEKLTQKTSRAGGKSPDVYNFGLSRDASLDYPLTDNLSTKYARSVKSDLDEYRGYAWLAVRDRDPGIVTDISENFSTSFTPQIFAWLKPNFNYSANYRWNQKLDSNVDGANVGRQLRFSSNLTLNPTTLVDLFTKRGAQAPPGRRRRGPDAAEDKAESQPRRGEFAKRLQRWSRKINPISLNYTENLGQTDLGIQGSVPLGYRFGWLPEHGRPHSDKIGTNTGSWNHKVDLALRSGLKITRNVNTNFNFSQAVTSSRSGAGVEQRTVARDYFAYGKSLNHGWPFFSWSLRWSGLEKYPFLRGVARSASLEHAVTGKESRSWQFENFDGPPIPLFSLARFVADYAEFERSSRLTMNYAPLVAMTLSLKKGISLTLRHNRSHDVARYYNGGIEISRDRSLNANANYSHRGGLTIPLPFMEDFDVQNTVNFSLNFDWSERDTRKKTQVGERFAETAFNSGWKTGLRITYSFTSKVSGSIIYEYRESDSKTLGKKVDRDFGFDMNIAITG